MDPAVLYYILKRRKKAKDIRKREWMHPTLTQRNIIGEHLKLENMLVNYPNKFKDHTRMTTSQFLLLEQLVTPFITKKDTTYRKAIPARTRLLITLRYLATGDSLQSLATNFCVGKSSVNQIIGDTCEAIWRVLSPRYLKPPTTKEDWLAIANEFLQKWQLPNCAGAIDGKHVTLVAPGNSGSQFYNYKGHFSIVLLATCDADYRFTTVDIGAYGRQSDGGIFFNSILGQLLERGESKLECFQSLPDSPYRLPLYLVGDEAFPLKSYLLRPYPANQLNEKRRIFNYRLSRGRRVIENCFGIMAMKFRVMRKPIHATREKAVLIVQACVALHNFLRSEEEVKVTTPANSNPMRQPMVDLTNASNVPVITSGPEMRECLCNYFMGEGAVSWQMTSVFG